MKFYTVDKLAIVILPAMMSEPAKKSKSLFNSFTRIHRLATLGGASIAAWFSTQLLQQGKVVTNDDMFATNPSPSDAPEMALKSMPSDALDESIQSASVDAPEASFEGQIAMESEPVEEMARMSGEAADTMMQSAPVMQGEPIVQILWSAVAVLTVIVAGLVIEVAITKRLKNIAKH